MCWWGAHFIRDVPANAVEIFYAHDASEYPDSRAVIDAASIEFPAWKKLEDDWIEEDYLGKGGLACLWSMQSVLRRIASESTNEVFIMIVDRYWIQKDWRTLERIFNDVSPFEVFQMRFWSRPHAEPFWERSPTHEVEMANYSLWHDYREGIFRGLGGPGDSCLAMTPKGARRILSWCERLPYHTLEIVLGEMAYDQGETQYCLYGTPSVNWSKGPIVAEAITGIPDSDRIIQNRKPDKL